MIHGETSTGVLQPLPEIARLAREHDALLMADVVVTLGGCEVAVDRWGDAAVAHYAGTARTAPSSVGDSLGAGGIGRI